MHWTRIDLSHIILRYPYLNLRQCLWAKTTFHSEPNTHRDADTQHLWCQSNCSCWTRTMEQSSIVSERGRLIVQWILALAKDIFVWIVGPRRRVNYFNCALPNLCGGHQVGRAEVLQINSLNAQLRCNKTYVSLYVSRLFSIPSISWPSLKIVGSLIFSTTW